MDGARQLRRLTGLGAGTIVLAASLTVLFLGMRDVMEIGGSCGSGGPYQIVRPCPEGTWLVPVSIFTGVAGVGLVAWFMPRGGPPLALLAWPALFLSLGWNFLEYGVDPPGGGGVAYGWLFCAVVFGLMGGVPLWFLAPSLVRARPVAVAAEVTAVAPMARVAAGDTTDAELVGGLERLDRLHRGGGLTDEEFTAAKWALLERDEPADGNEDA